MKAICQLYLPAFYRSYGREAIRKITELLGDLKKADFAGVYLIALFRDGGHDNGFDLIDYSVNPLFGTEAELRQLINSAHALRMTVGVDVVPNHVSDQHILARNCLAGVPGYEDCLYVVNQAEAERLTRAGVPSFFGKLAYSDFGDGKYVRTSFADYHQLNLNWQSPQVQEYFAGVFRRLTRAGIDFARIDCGMMLLENVLQADPANPLACFNPEASIEAIRQVSGEMPLFFEWFDPASSDLFVGKPGCYALDCSYVVTGQLAMDWEHAKLVPLLGGHDQMTAADREIDIAAALERMNQAEYGFLDMQTLIGWHSDSAIFDEDAKYDADLGNPNQRYRARRPIRPIVQKFVYCMRERG